MIQVNNKLKILTFAALPRGAKEEKSHWPGNKCGSQIGVTAIAKHIKIVQSSGADIFSVLFFPSKLFI